MHAWAVQCNTLELVSGLPRVPQQGLQVEGKNALSFHCQGTFCKAAPPQTGHVAGNQLTDGRVLKTDHLRRVNT